MTSRMATLSSCPSKCRVKNLWERRVKNEEWRTNVGGGTGIGLIDGDRPYGLDRLNRQIDR